MVARTITACASYDTTIIKSKSNHKYYILDPGGVMDAAYGPRCSSEVDDWGTTVGELEDHYLRKGDEVLTVDSWTKFRYFAEHFNIKNEQQFMEHINKSYNKGHETKIKARRMEWYHNGKLLTEGQHRELITDVVDKNDPNIDDVFDKVDVSPDLKQKWHYAVDRIANAFADPGILFNKLVQDQVNDEVFNNLAKGREERLKDLEKKVPYFERNQARKEWNELEDLATAHRTQQYMWTYDDEYRAPPRAAPVARRRPPPSSPRAHKPEPIGKPEPPTDEDKKSQATSNKMTREEALKIFNPENMENMDDITEATLRKRYLKLSRILHPDKGGSSEEFQKLTEAHQLLLGRQTGGNPIIIIGKHFSRSLSSKKRQKNNKRKRKTSLKKH